MVVIRCIDPNTLASYVIVRRCVPGTRSLTRDEFERVFPVCHSLDVFYPWFDPRPTVERTLSHPPLGTMVTRSHNQPLPVGERITWNMKVAPNGNVEFETSGYWVAPP